MIDEKKLRDEIGLRIRRARRGLDLTQAQLAEKANLAPKYLALIERNKVNVSLGALISIANGLNEPIEYFFISEGNDNLKQLPDKERSAVEELIKNLL